MEKEGLSPLSQIHLEISSRRSIIAVYSSDMSPMMAFCPNLLAQVCQKNRPKSVKLKGLFCCDNSFGVQPVISIGPAYPVGGYVSSAVYHEIREIGAIALFKHEIDANLFVQELETAHRQSPLHP